MKQPCQFPLVIFERCLNEFRKYRHNPDWCYISEKYSPLIPVYVINLVGIPITFNLPKDDRIRFLQEDPKMFWNDTGNPTGKYVDVLFTKEEIKLLDNLLKEYYDKKREEDYVNEEFQ